MLLGVWFDGGLNWSTSFMLYISFQPQGPPLFLALILVWCQEKLVQGTALDWYLLFWLVEDRLTARTGCKESSVMALLTLNPFEMWNDAIKPGLWGQLTFLLLYTRIQTFCSSSPLWFLCPGEIHQSSRILSRLILLSWIIFLLSYWVKGECHNKWQENIAWSWKRGTEIPCSSRWIGSLHFTGLYFMNAHGCAEKHF